MTSDDSPRDAREEAEARARANARKRVDELQAFYIHLTVFIAVNVLLFAIDLIQGDGVNWAYWTTFGWGIGLVAHAVFTFRMVPGVGEGWRQRKIDELTERELERDRTSDRR
jgi:hypothetical protein